MMFYTIMKCLIFHFFQGAIKKSIGKVIKVRKPCQYFNGKLFPLFLNIYYKQSCSKSVRKKISNPRTKLATRCVFTATFLIDTHTLWFTLGFFHSSQMSEPSIQKTAADPFFSNSDTNCTISLLKTLERQSPLPAATSFKSFCL